MPTYLYDVPSLISKRPALADIQNAFGNLDLNRHIAKGSEIQRDDVPQAKKAADVDDLANIRATLDTMSNTLTRIDMCTAILDAKVENGRILHRNSWKCANETLEFLQKVVPGSGYDKACAVASAEHQPMDINPPAEVGVTPEPINRLLEGYTYGDILQLIVFYNDDFGIQAGDNLSEQRHKVCVFLTE
ncbi:hypothetical protein NLJ89_g7688 [Agrocybe chaxingu]|uniref:Uncharacterized protein n=1 Tax=Agrocybe chaxingu TaxID=84603 RepID=A0A9W8MTG1_9AGAR|nr:hypothetical protein NLJ89_g7688 [Agrocybe chaxingu]